jgi:ribosomal protein S5
VSIFKNSSEEARENINKVSITEENIKPKAQLTENLYRFLLDPDKAKGGLLAGPSVKTVLPWPVPP